MYYVTGPYKTSSIEREQFSTSTEEMYNSLVKINIFQKQESTQKFGKYFKGSLF